MASAEVAYLDAQVYALTKERDMLRRDQSRKGESATLLKEKDEMIKQVMAEGRTPLMEEGGGEERRTDVGLL